MSNYNAQDFLNGQVLLIDKPLEWTSFQALNKVRYALKKTFNIKKIKVGHAGTLDPLATGLLIICTGKQTKNISEYMGLPKTYTGTVFLGASTPSYDLETQPDKHYSTEHITEELVRKTIKQFIGDIWQVPPIFSAIRKDGRKAYEAARKGEEIDLPARKVHISKFVITRFELPEIDFEINCSKGTYIRSLAHDFGKALDSGGYLKALRRTQIGDFSVNDAPGPVEFAEKLSKPGY